LKFALLDLKVSIREGRGGHWGGLGISGLQVPVILPVIEPVYEEDIKHIFPWGIKRFPFCVYVFSDGFLVIHVNTNSVDANIYVSLVSLFGVLVIGTMQVYYARNRVTLLQLLEERKKIEEEVHNLINQSILEGNIGRTLDSKLEPMKQNIEEIKNTLNKIDDRLRNLEQKGV